MHDPPRKKEDAGIEEKHFSCGICNAGCGLIAHVHHNTVIAIKPNLHHPLSRGYCCPKGLALAQVTNDPDRVRKPLKRVGNEFVPISWKQALHEIAGKVGEIATKDSPRAIAYYYGTNSVHSYHHSMWVKGFMDAVGSPNSYSAGSVDDNNKFVAQFLLYGNSVVMPIPDLAKTDFVLLIGTNPAVSNLSLVTCANVMKVLRGILARGGTIHLLDPRRNDTAKSLTHETRFHHHFIRPDTDIYLLLAMIYHIFAEHLEDNRFLEQITLHAEELRAVVKDYPPERVASLCQIPADVICALARQFATAKRGVIYGRLGTSLSSFNTLNAWAIDVLHVITGKMDRLGCLIFGKNVISIAKLGKLVGMGGFDKARSRVGNFPSVMGSLPLGTLAREILALKHPVKALFISGGNPLLTAPNSGEFRKALARVELCVVLDFYINETALAAAHYILPVTTPLERAQIPVYHLNYQVFPHVDYHGAVVQPPHKGPVDEWEILGSLMRLLHRPFFGMRILDLLNKLIKIVNRRGITPETFIRVFLWFGQVLEKRFPHLSKGTITFRQLKRMGFLLLGSHEYGVLRKVLQTPEKKIHLVDPRIQAQLKACGVFLSNREVITQGKQQGQLLLVNGRDIRIFNSWLHNVVKVQEPTLWVNSADAVSLKIVEEDRVVVKSNKGAIHMPAHVTDDIMPGVVFYPHGWGHRNPYLSRASQNPGENVNELTDSETLDTLSGIPRFNGTPVTIEARFSQDPQK